jgi:methionine synthase II (cobalamin-independent)
MGLDIVTDGNMWYDDYVGVIGSFCWYMYERIGGFEPSREEHPSYAGGPLVLSSDCGMGREGMSRRHAFYKMVSLVQGTNIVKQELGLPVKDSMGADPKWTLLRTK